MSLTSYCRKMLPTETDALYVWTLAYLLLPFLLFCMGWLHPLLAAVFCLGLLASGLRACSGTSDLQARRCCLSGWPGMLGWGAAFLLLLAWVSMSGVGGFGYQNLDWGVRNSLLFELITKPWPLQTNIDGHSRPVIYFMGYFLPASLVGILLGWKAANITLWLWTLLGVVLSFQWLIRLSGWRSSRTLFLCALLLIFFSGMDIIGDYIYKPGFGGAWHLETWVPFMQLSSMTTQLYWVPNHAIGGWLLASLLMYEGLTLKRSSNAGFLVAVAPVWSLFVGIGLLPFGLLVLGLTRLRQALSLQNIMALAMGLLQLLFILASAPAPDSTGWLGASRDLYQEWPAIFLFFFLEFGVCALLVYHCSPFIRRTRSWNWWFIVTSGVLLLFPWYKLGGSQTHELYMRGSIPALFFLLVFTAKVFGDRARSFWNHTGCTLLLLVVLIGAGTGMAELSRGALKISTSAWIQTPFIPPPLFHCAPHYFGKPDSFFFKYLSR